MPNIRSQAFALAVAILLIGTSGAFAADGSPEAGSGAGPVVVEPSTCSVAPRDDADALVNATPVERVFPDSEADLPQGEAASQEMTDIVVSIEQELSACIHDDDVLRVAALLTDEAAALFMADRNADVNPPSGVTTPEPALNVVRLTLVAVRDVRVLDDGRLGAVVIWVLARPGESLTGPTEPDLEANFHIYEEVDGQWLLAEELSGFIRQTRIIPVGDGRQLEPDVLGTPYLCETDGTPAA